MEEKSVIITEKYLKQLIDYESSKLVGKICKRMELLSDIETIKKESKELVYESFRDFRDMLLAYKEGRELVEFKFKTTSQPKQ